ncbi:hypothetical protein [Advenella mimigardefordensis]|uniref:Uncharacterized protein n=1 Tax=Advenella mimigardefordensis (strain DSM 17166 / LMG 22922 / DPN7) TaxID=1247726 RepID=W0P9K1_ADVMD|nr:hypothetical protein [Advenella mimigardefordensis]AHG63534.1 hypothetical protein MIM_c14430 [Advenella mimigardefordensis DPN7]
MIDRPIFRAGVTALLLAFTCQAPLVLAATNDPPAATTPASSTASPASDPITEAERKLFLDKHFANTSRQTIDYTFHQEGPSMATLNDKVKVDVRQRHEDGTASVNVDFLSGENHTPIEPIEHAEGNPALLGFLERDIAEMKRFTGGSTVYFRKRIRLALADSKVKVDKINVKFENQQVEADRITIQPYVNDPMKEKIGKYTAKQYVFVVSPKIPGGIYQVYTSEKFTDSQPARVDTSMTISGGEIPG